jgi:hypothetical protein
MKYNGRLTGLVTSYAETKTSYRRKDNGRDGSNKKTRKKTLEANG